MDDWCDGVKEGQLAFAGRIQNRLGQAGRGEGAGGDDCTVPFFRRQAGYLAALNRHERMFADLLCHALREHIPVDRQRTAGRQTRRIGLGHNDRAHTPHFFVDQAHGIFLAVIGAEGVGTHHFRQPVGRVRIGFHHAAHLVQDDGNAGAHQLPGRLGAGHAAADNVYGFVICLGHPRRIKPWGDLVKL